MERDAVEWDKREGKMSFSRIIKEVLVKIEHLTIIKRVELIKSNRLTKAFLLKFQFYK